MVDRLGYDGPADGIPAWAKTMIGASVEVAVVARKSSPGKVNFYVNKLVAPPPVDDDSDVPF